MGRLLSWVNRNFGEHTLGLYFAFVCDCVLVGEVHLERAEERGGGEGHSAVESLPLQPAKFTRKKCKQCARHTNSHTHTPFHTPAHTDSWTPKTNESANHCLFYFLWTAIERLWSGEARWCHQRSSSQNPQSWGASANGALCLVVRPPSPHCGDVDRVQMCGAPALESSAIPTPCVVYSLIDVGTAALLHFQFWSFGGSEKQRSWQIRNCFHSNNLNRDLYVRRSPLSRLETCVIVVMARFSVRRRLFNVYGRSVCIV